MAFNWTCPHCNKAQTVTDTRFSRKSEPVGVTTTEGTVVLEQTAIGCSNPECGKLTLRICAGPDIGKNDWVPDRVHPLFFEQILPRGSSKPQPDYIPAALREDYYEACLIKDLSPKASATLSRRCLQGMIRNFCGISKRRLIDEIKALSTAVEDGTADRAITPETVAAIDHIRSLGNIGAHMESDIDVIVAVDPGEAQAMIDLIELLFEEWYGARHRRTEKFAKIAKIHAEKAEIKRDAKEAKVAATTAEAPDGTAVTAH